jgi:hypothetical protein
MDRIGDGRARTDIDWLVEEGLLVRPRVRGDLLHLWPPIPLRPGTRLPSELVSELRDE